MKIRNILFILFCYVAGFVLAEIISSFFLGLVAIEFFILTIICTLFFFIIGLFVFDKIYY